MERKRYTVRFTWAEGETLVMISAFSEENAKYRATQILLVPTGDPDEDKENKAIVECPKLQISVELQYA